MRRQLPVLLLLVAAFVLGLVHLFKLRFDVGDVYPKYSSLRADPLGTMAFYESLERMPGIFVRRDFSASNQMPHGKETTYLHLGARTSDWRRLDEEVIKEIEGFVTSGGRLAITFFPETGKPFELFPDLDEAARATPQKKSARQKTEPVKPTKKKSNRREQEEKRLLRLASLKERWGIEFGYVRLEPGNVAAYEPALVERQGQLPLPETLDWHSATIFTNVPNSWQIVYSRGTNPVVLQRKFGSGTIVMASDSYFLSNEALRKDRHADLLSWWVGPTKHVLFDEAHFGIVETEGVAALLRKYRLYGLAAGLVLLAGLFIWKNSVSFIPPFQSEQAQDYVPGKEAAAGFVNLLRRNIPKRDVLNVCFGEWKKSCPQAGKVAPVKQAQAEAILQAENARAQRERAPVERYREISQILKKI